MDIVGMLKEFAVAFNKVFSWKTGGRSQDENAYRARAKQLTEEYNDALADGDSVRASRAYDDLRRLRDEARAGQNP